MFHENKKPVTLLTGYLGAGKTTVMNELLMNQTDKKIAVIVNDMGSVNIDAQLLKQGKAIKADSQMIELQNGCICCTLRDEFMEQLEQLSKQADIEAILVEASGISNPASIAEGFLIYQENHPKSPVYLNSIVTVVDADRIYIEFMEKMDKKEEEGTEQESTEQEGTEQESAEQEGIEQESTEQESAKQESANQKVAQEESDEDADIINLVMDQIEFCNLIILNKCDMLDRKSLDQVTYVLRQIQPDAEIIETIRGKVDADHIFQKKRFHYDEVNHSSAIQKALARENNASHEEHEYGVTSFVYEERRPFDYDRFIAFMDHEYPESIIRAKGYMWFADDDMHVQLFEQAGRNASVSELSNWLAAFDDKERQDVIEQYPEVLEEWDETYGDRLNQIVFIGRNYDQEWLTEKLNECLAPNQS